MENTSTIKLPEEHIRADEKGTPPTDSSSRAHLSASRRFHQLIHPSGRKIHIASSPEEAERLKRTLSGLPDDDGFDIVIHGSPEHVDKLKEAHSHFDEQRNAFRAKHGDVYDEFERVHKELDILSGELQEISSHAIELDANFSKFGYSARIRTHDHSPNHSSNTSLYGGRSSSTDSQAAYYNRDSGSAMKLFVKPICRQYFHKGLLWRAHEPEETTSYELFLDLLYVGIIAISGDSAAEEATGEALLRFAITFILSWRIWTDVTVFMNWFDCDDVTRRITILFVLTCLLGYTTNIVDFLHETYTPGLAFYLTARLFNAGMFAWYGWLIPMVRNALIGNALNIIIPSAVWAASVHVEEPRRQALIWVAIFFDVCGSLYFIFVQRGILFRGDLKERVKKAFDFYPAINIEHRIERTGAFVSLVFGYSVVSLLYQSRAAIGVNAYFGKAALGLIQAFSFNWIYFEIDSYNLHTHAIRRHAISSLTWFTMHLPFTLSFTLAGAALARIVLVRDTPDAHFDDLAEFSSDRSEQHFSAGQRWFYCAGLGIALLCMNVISVTHVYKTFKTPNSRTPKWVEKPTRLVIRTVVGIILICLGAVKSLDSLSLIAITTCLVVFSLAFELFGHMAVCGGRWTQGERKCAYGARCHISKKDLEAHVKKGEVVRVEDLNGEKGAYNLT